MAKVTEQHREAAAAIKLGVACVCGVAAPDSICCCHADIAQAIAEAAVSPSAPPLSLALEAELSEIEARLNAADSMVSQLCHGERGDGWLPIESAPKDKHIEAMQPCAVEGKKP